MSKGSMFDLEDCQDVKIDSCKTTSTTLIKGRNIEGLTVIKSEAGLSELEKLGLPIEQLNDEQINEIVGKLLSTKSKNDNGLDEWLNQTAIFATLGSDVKLAIISGILASAKMGYEKLKDMLSK